MNGRTLQGWPDAWRLTWSFLWRQALALLLGSALLGLVLALLQRVGLIGPAFLFNTIGFFTTALLVLSCAVSFRLLIAKFDFRMPSGRAEPGRRRDTGA